MKTCAILLADGFEEIEAVVPADILRRAGVQVHIVSTAGSGLCVRGAHSVKIEADITCADLLDRIKQGGIPDAVFCPGGMPGSTNLAANTDISFILETAQRQGKIIAAICAAPAVVLAPLGLLDGKNFTGYPGTENLTKTAPHAEPKSYADSEVVRDGTLITSRGPGAAAALGFELAALLTDEKTAADIKKAMLFL